MIKCPLCGTDNQIGAIFCRGCREKLDLDSLRPETMNQHEGKMGTKIFHVLRRIVTAAIFLYLLWALVAVFLSLELPQTPKLTDKENKVLTQRFRNLKRKIKKSRGEEFVFNSAEITALANQLTNLKDDPKKSGWALSPAILNIQLLSDGTVRVILKSRLKDQIDMYTSVRGKFYVPEGEDGVQFIMLSAKSGKLDMKFGLKKIALNRITILLSDIPLLADLKKNISEITVSADSISIRLKK